MGSQEEEKKRVIKMAGKLLSKRYGVDIPKSDLLEKFLYSVVKSNEDYCKRELPSQKEVAQRLLEETSGTVTESTGAQENNRNNSGGQESQPEVKLIAALLARALLQAIIKANKSVKARYKALACAFEDEAVEQLENLQKNPMNRARELLLKRCKYWGDLDCISLAVKTEFRRFLDVKSARKAITSVWRADIDCQSHCIWFWDDEQKSTKTKICRCCKMICQFIQAPIGTFSLDVVFYLIFLGLYSYMVMMEFGENPGRTEIAIIAWVFTGVFGEIIEAFSHKRWKARFKFYISSAWNYVNILGVFIFGVGVILRFVPFPYHIDVARIFYSADLILFCAKYLQILTVSKFLGPKLVMIKAMFLDLLGFCIILFAIMYGYAVATHAILYPNSRLTLRLPFDLAKRAFFQIFGELFLEEFKGSDPCTDNATLYEDLDIPRCPSYVGTRIAPILLWAYLLFTNVLLLNLLTAMFTFTVSRIQKNEKQYGNLERAKLTLAYKDGPALPAPLNVFCSVYRCCIKKYCQKCACCRPCGGQSRSSSEEGSGQTQGTQEMQDINTTQRPLDQVTFTVHQGRDNQAATVEESDESESSPGKGKQQPPSEREDAVEIVIED